MKKSRLAILRLLCDALLFILIFLTPSVFAFLAGAAFLFFLPHFYEFLFAAFLLDILYGAPTPLFSGFQFLFSVSAIALFVCVEAAKRRMRFY